jgi:2,5-diamino-6-(ribosylamino)-4(3H)-pyrimidinone 5'-phosphate reductase
VKSVQRKIERKEKGFDENPVRVIIDSQARTPIDADIFKKGEGRRIVVVSSSAASENVEALREKARVIITGESRVDLPDAMKQLYLLGINRLMVEGGATLKWAMLSSGLVDEIYTFVGNVIIGGQVAPTLVDGEGFKDTSTLPLELISAEKIEQGILLKWKVLNFQ